MTRFKIRKKLWKVATVTVLSLATFSAAESAQAASLTSTSPTAKGVLPTEITPVGGIVLDLIGQNNSRVTSQLGSNKLFKGRFNNGKPADYEGNPGTIGIQSGFTSTIIDALGGGIKELAVRFTLFDGDTGVGNFDHNDNTLLVNNINFGNWGSVITQNTDALGNEAAAGVSGGGFRSNTLDTGWFHVTDKSNLDNFYTSLVNTQEVVYQLDDVDPNDNYYDFKQGIKSSIIKVTQAPVVEPSNSVPEPLTIFGTLTAGAFGVALRRKQKQQQKATTNT
ncbi:hypothetical protein NIES2100_63580 [Calothrix sp. NIES-2100]|uniref:PEP-CTERM sorting domain-containing protein n=1 Tax=Calothrix sp. NIES-2100 TaxID=1954172 RepID=UPI000B619D81|nr:hypothetical protein NIES2100_63580 [Calothrix sp. NIES-2100]